MTIQTDQFPIAPPVRRTHDLLASLKDTIKRIEEQKAALMLRIADTKEIARQTRT